MAKGNAERMRIVGKYVDTKTVEWEAGNLPEKETDRQRERQVKLQEEGRGYAKKMVVVGRYAGSKGVERKKGEKTDKQTNVEKKLVAGRYMHSRK